MIFIYERWSAVSAGGIDLWYINGLFFEKDYKVEPKKINISKISLKVKYDNVIVECSDSLLGMINKCKAKQ